MRGAIGKIRKSPQVSFHGNPRDTHGHSHRGVGRRCRHRSRCKGDKDAPTRGKKPRSGATVNREMACLGAMLNKAVMWELIPKNPATPVKDFKEPAGRNSFLWREIRNGQIYLGGERTENGKPREIPISDRLTNELQRIKAAQGGERITMLTNQVFMASRERKRRFNGILQVVDGPMRDIRVASEIQPAEG